MMLVLSRRIGERVLIGRDVVVTIVRIGPNSVRIGIEAPPAFDIAREEIASTPTPLMLAEADDVCATPHRR